MKTIIAIVIIIIIAFVVIGRKGHDANYEPVNTTQGADTTQTNNGNTANEEGTVDNNTTTNGDSAFAQMEASMNAMDKDSAEVDNNFNDKPVEQEL